MAFIPPSSNTVSVSIIDTGARIRGSNPSMFLSPIIPGFGRRPADRADAGSPSYAFLITHEDNETGKKQRYLFDMSMQKDLDSLTTATKNLFAWLRWDVQVPKDVRDVLQEGGIGVEDIDGIIWSHWHWDHCGDPTQFPPKTELVVGPGFKEHLTPAYPTNPESGIREDAWRGRRLREIIFDGSVKIANFDAFDFFGDGSFYLLDSFGHTIGHLCGLARTTPDTFILMGGDSCHHPSVIRPSKQFPLPESIVPNPFTGSFSNPCPCAMFESLHPAYRKDEPFHTYPDVPDGGVNYSRKAALETREKLMNLDGNENVLTVIAHDTTVMDVLKFFPESANNWKKDGWDKIARWIFLRDWYGAVEDKEKI